MKKILVVDDRLEVRLLVSIALKNYGCQLIEASSGDSGITEIYRHKPALVLLDVMMPGTMNGFEICRKVKQDIMLRSIPIVMMSALGQADDLAKGAEAGADSYIVKPFSLSKLQAVVNKFINIV